MHPHLKRSALAMGGSSPTPRPLATRRAIRPTPARAWRPGVQRTDAEPSSSDARAYRNPQQPQEPAACRQVQTHTVGLAVPTPPARDDGRCDRHVNLTLAPVAGQGMRGTRGRSTEGDSFAKGLGRERAPGGGTRVLRSSPHNPWVVGSSPTRPTNAEISPSSDPDLVAGRDDAALQHPAHRPAPVPVSYTHLTLPTIYPV